MTNSEKETPVMKPVHYVGFWARACADFIDSCFLDAVALVLAGMILGVIFWFRKLVPDSSGAELTYMQTVNPFVLQMVLVVLRVGASLFYYTWGTYRYQTTLGKRCLRISIVSVKGHTGSNYSPVTLEQSLVRCLAYILSYLPMGAGFLMVMFNSKKRGLHDLIAGTACIQTPKN